ncbi:MAG: universal stress protein [Stagnimonas sp.]|nr:universal stress protein [Stagnimonas sp.]
MSQRKILVLIEHSSPSSAAVRRAIALARSGRAKVSLCLFVHRASIDAIGHLNGAIAELARESLLSEARLWLHRQLQLLKDAGVEASAEALWQRPQPAPMLAKVRQLQPDLVIKDIQLETLPQRLLLNPLDWHLLRDSGCEIMLVNPESGPLPQRVIAAVDPLAAEHVAGQLNERIVQAARDLARLSDCPLELVHAFEGMAPLTAVDPLGQGAIYTELYEQSRELSRQRFHDFANRQGLPAECLHLLHGAPWMALADYAGEQPGDLLVLGSVQHHGLGQRLLGSTAERILDSAHCDLLLVRPGADLTTAGAGSTA